jgi:hypothetical protein
LNAAKCKSISFNRNKKPIGFDYPIEGYELEHVEEIRDLGVIFDTRMSFLSHVETIISKSARMLGFIERISREFNDHYTDKALFVSLVRPNFEYVARLWSPHQVCHSERVKVVQLNFVMLFAGFTGRSTQWQNMILVVPCWVLIPLKTDGR